MHIMVLVAFTKKHRDQFKADSGRKYSIVVYLNDLWLEEDGGQLVIYRKDDQISVSPHGGKVVIFQNPEKEKHSVFCNPHC